MKTFNPFNPIQNKWMVKLTLIYWANGDVKDLYEDEDYQNFKDLFHLHTDQETEQWLNVHKYIYQNWHLLKIGL